MKFNYKIDYWAQTAAHYTTFPQTEQSQRILAKNAGTLQRIADTASQGISQQATRRARQNLLGGKVNIFA